MFIRVHNIQVCNTGRYTLENEFKIVLSKHTTPDKLNITSSLCTDLPSYMEVDNTAVNQDSALKIWALSTFRHTELWIINGGRGKGGTLAGEGKRQGQELADETEGGIVVM